MPAPRYETAEERIEMGTVYDPETGCRLWCEGTGCGGYGHVSVHQEQHLVHRLAWEIERGPIPAGMVIDHKCRNRRCCRVEHLRIVSRRTNTLENSLANAAMNVQKAHCPKCGGPYFTQGDGRRRCRRCVRKYARGYYAKRLRIDGDWPKPVKETK